MAIFGKMEHIAAQLPNIDRLKKGLEFLSSFDVKAQFAKMGDTPKEIIKIDGDNLFAIFEQYNSKDILYPIFEGHLKYTDIQYIVSGEELMHISSPDRITREDEYKEDRDIYFPKVSSYSTLLAQQGSVAIFFPSDLHSPSNCIKASKPVQKVVIKVINA